MLKPLGGALMGNNMQTMSKYHSTQGFLITKENMVKLSITNNGTICHDMPPDEIQWKVYITYAAFVAKIFNLNLIRRNQPDKRGLGYSLQAKLFAFFRNVNVMK